MAIKWPEDVMKAAREYYERQCPDSPSELADETFEEIFTQGKLGKRGQSPEDLFQQVSSAYQLMNDASVTGRGLPAAKATYQDLVNDMLSRYTYSLRCPPPNSPKSAGVKEGQISPVTTTTAQTSGASSAGTINWLETQFESLDKQQKIAIVCVAGALLFGFGSYHIAQYSLACIAEETVMARMASGAGQLARVLMAA